MPGLIAADKRFLCDIVGIAGVAEEAITEIDDGMPVPLHHFRQCSFGAVSQLFQQLIVHVPPSLSRATELSSRRPGVKYAGMTAILWLAMLLLGANTFAQEPGITVQASLARDATAPGSTFRVSVALDLPSPWHVNANPAASPDFIPTTLTWAPNPSVRSVKIIYPRGQLVAVPWADAPVSLYSGKTIIAAVVTIISNTTLTGVLKYQACDDKVCYAPKSVPVTLRAEVGDGGPGIVPVGVRTEKTAAPTPADSDGITSLINKNGLFGTLLIVFVWGLALNLTPCVWPMIPITISYFGGSSDRNVRRTFALAVTYFLGIALTYSTLGLVAALTGSLFGNFLQLPLVLVAIAVIFLALALSMFGLYELQPPRFLMQRATGLSAKAGFIGVFFLGATMGIVAAPCLAPGILALLLFVGKTGSPWLGWWMFFALSCGLGLPYIVLGTFSGALARLPKSGMWMVWVKRVFGVVLIGAAAWVTLPLWRSKGVSWPVYSTEAVQQAAIQGKPVVIDFSASWCGECREMERTTFRDQRVIAAGRSFFLLQVDLSNDESPTGKALTAKYQILGLPTLLFLDPAGREHAELRQVGYLTADSLLGLLERARRPAPTNALDSSGSVPLQLMQ